MVDVDTPQPLAVFVIGPESSGSKLTARIVAHVLEVADFDEWDGSGLCGDPARPGNRVCHRSAPFLIPPQWPDPDEWVRTQEPTHEPRFVLTTRDRSISERSRIRRFSKSASQVAAETDTAINLLSQVLGGDHPAHIHSYESVLLLGPAYLQLLYRFLGVSSTLLPPLSDANPAYLAAVPWAGPDTGGENPK